MALQLTTPAVILCRGNVFQAVCVQAQASGPNAPGPNAPLALLNVDTTGTTTAQLWQYGSDQRIYLYDGTDNPAYCIGLQSAASEELPLILVSPVTNDTTQQWTLSTDVPSIVNVANKSSYCMNAAGSACAAGDSVIIFSITPTPTNNVVWSFAVYPDFPGQIT